MIDDNHGRIKCMVCGYIAPNGRSRDVRRHIESKHIRMMIVCKYCGSNTRSRRNFEIHLRHYHPNQLIEAKSMPRIVQWHVKDVKFDVVFE